MSEVSKVLLISEIDEAHAAAKFDGLTVWEFFDQSTFPRKNNRMVAVVANSYPHHLARFVRIDADKFKFHVEVLGIKEFPTYCFSKNGAPFGWFLEESTIVARSVSRDNGLTVWTDEDYIPPLKEHLKRKVHREIGLLL